MALKKNCCEHGSGGVRGGGSVGKIHAMREWEPSPHQSFKKPGMMVCGYKPSTGEAEGGSLCMLLSTTRPRNSRFNEREALPQHMQGCMHILRIDSISCYGDRSIFLPPSLPSLFPSPPIPPLFSVFPSFPAFSPLAPLVSKDPSSWHDLSSRTQRIGGERGNPKTEGSGA